MCFLSGIQLPSLNTLSLSCPSVSSNDLEYLFQALSTNKTISNFHLELSLSPTFTPSCTKALAFMLKQNSTITYVTPAEQVLLEKCDPVECYTVMDALHVAIINPSSNSLLPYKVRLAFRQGLGLPLPDVIHNIPDNSGCMILPSQLGDVQTWKKIGSGQFGVVYSADFNGETVCVKTISSESTDELESCYREFALIQTCENKSHLSRYCVFPRNFCLPPPHIVDRGSMWFVCDFMENGSLSDYLMQHPDISPHTIVDVLFDIAQALAACHAEHVIHRDIAGRNVLLDSKLRAKLCDFGLSCRTDQYWQSDSVPVPIPIWAPEVVVSLPHRDRNLFSPAADVWSFGLLMVECFNRRSPFLHLTYDSKGGFDNIFRFFTAIRTFEVDQPRLFQVSSPSQTDMLVHPPDAEQFKSYYKPAEDSNEYYQDPGVNRVGVLPPLSLAELHSQWQCDIQLPHLTDIDYAVYLPRILHRCCMWDPTRRFTMSRVVEKLREIKDHEFGL
jgi:serine/threonine protein kinase